MEEDNNFFQPEERRSLEAKVNTLEPISSSSNCNSDIVAHRDSLMRKEGVVHISFTFTAFLRLMMLRWMWVWGGKFMSK
jgi:hypothetical protein